MEHLVFIFGTLKEGFPNFGINRGTRVPGEFKTCAAYSLYLVGERHSKSTCMHMPPCIVPVRSNKLIDTVALAAGFAGLLSAGHRRRLTARMALTALTLGLLIPEYFVARYVAL
jgi:hypothetical protein